MAAASPATVAVMTANSNTGFACVKRLLEAHPDVSVRAVFRSAGKSSALDALPASADAVAAGRLTTVVGPDAANPASLPPAFAGATTAVIVTPHNPAAGIKDDARLTAAMIHAAVDAGVKHIVYVGSWTVLASKDLPMLADRFAPSEELLASLESVTWTSLRSGYFFGNLLGLLGQLRKGDTLTFPDVVFPPVDPADVGHIAAAVAAVHGAGYQGQHIVVSGPEQFSTSELAELCASRLGRPAISHHAVPASEFVKPLPPYLAELLTYMERAGKDALPFNPRGVESITGRPAATLGDWIEARAAALEKE
jgi:uncharacterized protein YbjT (DUF2867 family)